MGGINTVREQRSRRDFLARASALGAAGLSATSLAPLLADPPPETTRIRLMKASLCTAPAYVAEELLRREGFSDVQYLDDDPREIGTSKLVATGDADLNMSFGLTTLVRVEAGRAGGHARWSAHRLLRAIRHGARAIDPRPAWMQGRRPGYRVDAPPVPERHGLLRGVGPAPRDLLGRAVAGGWDAAAR